MTERPFFRYSTQQLEQHFEANPNDMDELRKLQAELIHREKPKAVKLSQRVQARIKKLESGIKAPIQIKFPGLSPEPAKSDLPTPPEVISAPPNPPAPTAQADSYFSKIIDGIKSFSGGVS